MRIEELRNHADSIPELGHGGKTCGEKLIELASKVKPGESIIDIAPWLGSTTAYLALGVMQSGNDCEIHSYDKWEITEGYQEKAHKYHGIDFPIGHDLLEDWRENTKIFSINIYPHKGFVEYAKWTGNPIGLIIDDISNTYSRISKTMGTFGPFIAPGASVVLMDWKFDCHGQKQWILFHNDLFTIKEVFPFPSMAAQFVRTHKRWW